MAATAVPVMGITVSVPPPFTRSSTEPLALPAFVGVKVTVNVTCCPAATVAGIASPLRPNPGPLVLADEIVRASVPVLLNWIVCEFDLPTTTLPNETCVGDTPNCELATPVPLSETL